MEHQRRSDNDNAGISFPRVIQWGHLLQAATIAVGVGGSLMAAGTWLSDIKSAIHEEAEERKHELAEANARMVQLMTLMQQRDALLNQNAIDHTTIMDQMAQIERSFQHVFSAAQPQPRQR
jgi:hypothetical protein